MGYTLDSTMQRQTILLVDDEEFLRRMLAFLAAISRLLPNRPEPPARDDSVA